MQKNGNDLLLSATDLSNFLYCPHVTTLDLFTKEMHYNEFDIKILQLRWIHHIDDPADLCAHGSVFIRIADKVVVDENDGDGWTLSAAALNLMRTLEKDYNPGDFDGQLIPCCGFFLIADEETDCVHIHGCNSGFDWTIQHVGNLVRHQAKSGEQALINKEEYQKLILSFADKVQQFYMDSAPKSLPADEFDQRGYVAFWKEWQTLREVWK